MDRPTPLDRPFFSRPLDEIREEHDGERNPKTLELIKRKDREK